MIANKDCTIYTRNADGTYTRQTAKCHWEDMRGINFNNTGASDVDSVFVMIELDQVELPILSEKSKKQNYILRGVVYEDIDASTIAEFMSGHDVLTITAIERNDYSLGAASNHWVVYAK